MQEDSNVVAAALSGQFGLLRAARVRACVRVCACVCAFACVALSRCRVCCLVLVCGCAHKLTRNSPTPVLTSSLLALVLCVRSARKWRGAT